MAMFAPMVVNRTSDARAARKYTAAKRGAQKTVCMDPPTSEANSLGPDDENEMHTTIVVSQST